MTTARLRSLARSLGPLMITVTSLLLCVACGERSVRGGDGTAEGGSTRDASTPPADGTLRPDKSTPPSSACVIAVRFPSCCPELVLVTERDIAADACLARWPASRPQGCPQLCKALCQTPTPPSRLATRATDGVCRYSHECQSDVDCKLGSNVFACCDCGGVYPKTFLAEHPCYGGDPDRCVEKCPVGAPQCGCPPLSFAIRAKCEVGGPFRLCTLVAP